jgi:hypothetical protein
MMRKKIKDYFVSYKLRKIFAFYLNGYKKKFYYWEFIKIGIKNLLAGVYIYFYDYENIVKPLFSIIIFLYLMLTNDLNPYGRSKFYKLDFQVNLTLMVMSILGLLFTTKEVFWFILIA